MTLNVNTLLIILILLVIVGGGGYARANSWDGPRYGGLGLIVIILLILLVTGVLR